MKRFRNLLCPPRVLVFVVSGLQMEGPFSGIVRVAVLPHPWDKDSETTLTRHAYAYPRGGRVNFAVDGDRMEMR